MSAQDAAPDRPDAQSDDDSLNPTPSATKNRVRPTADGPTDDELIERIRNGDQAAMRRLVDRHQRRLYQLALGILKDHEDALDVVQEAFIKVHSNLSKFKGDSAFYTWIYRITYNLSIDVVRKSGRGHTVAVEDSTLTDEGEQYEPYGEQSQSPQKAALRGELGAHLQRALATLSENHRAIIVMREVDGLSYEELSDALGVPKGTVMSRLFHARQKMQIALREYLGDDAPDFVREG